MITCEILSKGMTEDGPTKVCGAVAIGWTIDKVPVCPDCADDDTLQIVTLVDPFPVEYIGEKFKLDRFTSECLFSLTKVFEELAKKPSIFAEILTPPPHAATGEQLDRYAASLGVQGVAGALCSGCKVKPATGILGLCADCAPEYGYTDDEIARLDKEQPPIGIAPEKLGDVVGRAVHQQVAEHVQLNLPIPLVDRGPADLIRKRAAAWSRRSDDWHAKLENDRAWARRGLSLPIIVSAIGVVFGSRTVSPDLAGFVTMLVTLILGAIGWRASTARTRLDTTRAADAWVIADRMAEWYRGCVADLDTLPSRAARGELREVTGQQATPLAYELEHLRRSQRMEASARFGLPEHFRLTLEEVVEDACARGR